MELKTIDLNKILHSIDELSNIDKDKAIRGGLAAAANGFKSGGIRRLKQRMKNPIGITGNLLKSFSSRVKKRKPGALAGFDYPTGAHAHLLDRGTKERYYKTKSKKSVGKILGKDSTFKLNFWEDTKRIDEAKALQATYRGIERAINRINTRR